MKYAICFDTFFQCPLLLMWEHGRPIKVVADERYRVYGSRSEAKRDLKRLRTFGEFPKAEVVEIHEEEAENE